MRVLVIGAGRMAALRAEHLVADPRVHEVVIANRSAERADHLAARLGLTSVPWSHVAGVTVDGAIVASATAAHTDALERILPQGIPVLCEKPIALSLAETQRMIDHANAGGSTLQVAFQRRFDPAMRAARDRVAQGRVGTLYAVRMMAHDAQPGAAEFIASSGGIFRDLLVHDLDLLAWLTGSPVDRVYATLAVREHRQYDVVHRTAAGEAADGDVAVVHAVTASGVQASLHATRHDPRGHDVRLELFGSLDSLSAGLTPRTPLMMLEGHGVAGAAGEAAPPAYRDFIDRFADAFRAETQAFLDLVGGASNPCPPHTALESLRAAIACEVSQRSGTPVTVAQISTAQH